MTTPPNETARLLEDAIALLGRDQTPASAMVIAEARAHLATLGAESTPNSDSTPPNQQTPQPSEWLQRCPVCSGHGKMPHGFFDHLEGQSSESTACEHIKCRPCNGTGIIARHCPKPDGEARRLLEVSLSYMEEHQDAATGQSERLRNTVSAIRAYLTHPPSVATTGTGDGVELIAAERKRQVEKEGWSAGHDDEHDDGEIARAAACYALPPEVRAWKKLNHITDTLWPWFAEWWKPCPDDRVRELVKAGALIAAEIDRLQRAALSRSADKEGGGR